MNSQSQDNKHTREQHELYVGRITTRFATLERLLTILLRCMISEDAQITTVIMKEGFPRFAKKFGLLKKICAVRFPKDQDYKKVINMIGQSNSLRRKAAHASISSVNPGTTDEHWALYVPKEPFAKNPSTKQMENNIGILKATNSLIFDLVNRCHKEKKT